MHTICLIVGVFVLLAVGLDAFQTVILPRRPSGRFRLTRLFYISTWLPWVAIAERITSRRKREQLYSIFGPVSLLLLLGLWAFFLVSGFALVYFALGSPFQDSLNRTNHFFADLRTDLYVSGTTLFTLGLGDVTPNRQLVRAILVLESGTGLGFVALVIGYIPILYQAFSRREITVALLDVRAGSPPTAAELLRRHSFEGGQSALIELLSEWERWSAEILETHVSYPLLCYYRSQHDNQSWLSAVVCILDTCALLITTISGPSVRQAQLTFAMARHALVDFGHIFNTDHRISSEADFSRDRLSPEVFDRLCDALAEMKIQLCGDPDSIARLSAIRALYEPQACVLSDYLRMPLPEWVARPLASTQTKPDQWKKVADLRADAPTPEFLFRSASHVSAFSTAAGHLREDED